MFEFTLRQCRVYRDLSRNVAAYAKTMASMAQEFDAKVGLSYDKVKDELKIACRGAPPTAAAIFATLMGGAMILGARQDREWLPIMRKAYEIIEQSEEGATVMNSLAEAQLELANRIRVAQMQEAHNRRNCDMHEEFAN